MSAVWSNEVMGASRWLDATAPGGTASSRLRASPTAGFSFDIGLSILNAFEEHETLNYAEIRVGRMQRLRFVWLQYGRVSISDCDCLEIYPQSFRNPKQRMETYCVQSGTGRCRPTVHRNTPRSFQRVEQLHISQSCSEISKIHSGPACVLELDRFA